LDAGFDAPCWAKAEEGVIGHFRAESSAHRPEVRFRVLHDGTHLYVRFLVCDQYVRSVRTNYQDSVCLDSCVEFFVRPRPKGGYFNFEVNAGGALLLSYVEDWSRLPRGGFAKWTPVSESWGRRVTIWHSQPAVVDPEIATPVTWGIAYRVPVALFEAFAGPLGGLSGQRWHANFYKCGDQTSHPHWAAWSPVPKLNFHLPDSFGEITFA
jgi:hypothetical protein